MNSRLVVLLVPVVVGVFLLGFATRTYTYDSSYSTVAGIAGIQRVDEVDVTTFLIAPGDSIIVGVSSKVATKPDVPYLATLYIQAQSVTDYSFSWSATELGNVERQVRFTGLAGYNTSLITLVVTR